MKKSKSRLLHLATLMVLTSMFVSCAGDTDGGHNSSQAEQQDEGSYSVTLTPINAGIGGNNAMGAGKVSIEGDNITIKLDMTGTPASMTHIQHIHASGACPTSAQDANGDGFVDVVEGDSSYGKILIPLDGDLSSQLAGFTNYPSANSAGAYSYSESTSLALMETDLQLPDIITTDSVIKLQDGEGLNLAGRTFVVHGVPNSANLPDTVGTIDG